MNKIGFAITTKNRPVEFKKCFNSISRYAPENSIIAVVDDGSDTDYSVGYGDIRCSRSLFSEGISKSKNNCIELLYSRGCDHFFLLDDDTIALKEKWFIPFIESGEHHLCATFLPSYRNNGQIKIHQLGNGYCMYFTKHCIDTVGGFDANYHNKYEHVDLSRRIHNAGLTRHAFMDVINSHELIYCLDKDNAIGRSFSAEEMDKNLKDGLAHFNKQRNSSDYIEFRSCLIQ